LSSVGTIDAITFSPAAGTVGNGTAVAGIGGDLTGGVETAAIVSNSGNVTLSASTGGGSGELAGIVYLDANDNGHCDAGELGAPNLTVVLDGRFSVQTVVSGRFDFPAVASGHHVISVVSDNLPLPWTLVGDGRLEVLVTTRDRTDLAIAAHRPR